MVELNMEGLSLEGEDDEGLSFVIEEGNMDSMQCALVSVEGSLMIV